MKQRPYADAMNTFWRLPTPSNAPLRAGLPDMLRFRTHPICQKCGKQWPSDKPLIIQIPKWVDAGGVLVPGPGINDQKVIEQMMVIANNKGTGCWSECNCGRNFRMQCIAQCVERGVPDARPGDCPCVCACRVACGNRKIYPCRCGYTSIFHMKGCPVADFKRDFSFMTSLVRQRLSRGKVRA